MAPNLWAQLGGLLWAPGMREPWPSFARGAGEEYEASCQLNPDHTPPAEGCTCGIYSFYNPTLGKTGGYWPEPQDRLFNRVVAGVIGAAGEVVLHEDGLLAARATVEAIFTDGADDEELPMPRRVIADAYGADVIDSEDFAEFCAARGLIVFGAEDL